jgi:hypothetical protein
MWRFLALFILGFIPPSAAADPSAGRIRIEGVRRLADDFQERVAGFPRWNSRILSESQWEVKNEEKPLDQKSLCTSTLVCGEFE